MDEYEIKRPMDFYDEDQKAQVQDLEDELERMKNVYDEVIGKNFKDGLYTKTTENGVLTLSMDIPAVEDITKNSIVNNSELKYLPITIVCTELSRNAGWKARISGKNTLVLKDLFLLPELLGPSNELTVIDHILFSVEDMKIIEDKLANKR